MQHLLNDGVDLSSWINDLQSKVERQVEEEFQVLKRSSSRGQSSLSGSIGSSGKLYTHSENKWSGDEDRITSTEHLEGLESQLRARFNQYGKSVPFEDLNLSGEVEIQHAKPPFGRPVKSVNNYMKESSKNTNGTQKSSGSGNSSFNNSDVLISKKREHSRVVKDLIEENEEVRLKLQKESERVKREEERKKEALRRHQREIKLEKERLRKEKEEEKERLRQIEVEKRKKIALREVQRQEEERRRRELRLAKQKLEQEQLERQKRETVMRHKVALFITKRKLKCLKKHFAVWHWWIEGLKARQRKVEVLIKWKQRNQVWHLWRRLAREQRLKREAQQFEAELLQEKKLNNRADLFRDNNLLSRCFLHWFQSWKIKDEEHLRRAQHLAKKKQMELMAKKTATPPLPSQKDQTPPLNTPSPVQEEIVSKSRPVRSVLQQTENGMRAIELDEKAKKFRGYQALLDKKAEERKAKRLALQQKALEKQEEQRRLEEEERRKKKEERKAAERALKAQRQREREEAEEAKKKMMGEREETARKMSLAASHCELQRKRRAWRRWGESILESKQKMERAKEFEEMRLYKTMMDHWKTFISDLQQRKEQIARNHYRKNMKRKLWKVFCEVLNFEIHFSFDK